MGYSTFWSAPWRSSAVTALASGLKKQSFKPLQSSCHCTSASHSNWKKLLNYSSAASEWWHNPPWFTALEQTWKVWYSCSPSDLTIRVSILFILWVCLATGRSTWTISEHFFMWCKRNWSCSYNQITSCQGPCVKPLWHLLLLLRNAHFTSFCASKNTDHFKYPRLTCIHFFSGF